MDDDATKQPESGDGSTGSDGGQDQPAAEDGKGSAASPDPYHQGEHDEPDPYHQGERTIPDPYHQ
ncbi:MAG: hypothetical protein ACM3ML_32250 [Micromonosporaceae bacterium]